MIISENITSIFDFYSTDEKIIHKKIGLLSFYSIDDFEPTLVLLKNKFPKLQIEYTQVKNNSKSLCMANNTDLDIIIPFGILEADSGTFKYSFQSHTKNIFGTLEIQLMNNGDDISLENIQLFSTSIGD